MGKKMFLVMMACNVVQVSVTSGKSAETASSQGVLEHHTFQNAV